MIIFANSLSLIDEDGVVGMVAKKVVVSAEDRVVLERIVRARTCERRMLERAQAVLLASDGLSAAAIERVGCSEFGEACQAVALAL